MMEAKHVAFYKGHLVVKTPTDDASFSCGVIFLGSGLDENDVDMLLHEYGHTEQLDSLGVVCYLNTIVYPSVTCFALSSISPKLEQNYYSLPWEYSADKMGGVSRTHADWAETAANIYWMAANFISDVYGLLIGPRGW